MPKKLKPFSARIKSARGKRTQQQAADTIGVSIKTYVNWEQGRNTPDAFKQRALLDALR